MAWNAYIHTTRGSYRASPPNLVTKVVVVTIQAPSSVVMSWLALNVHYRGSVKRYRFNYCLSCLLSTTACVGCLSVWIRLPPARSQHTARLVRCRKLCLRLPQEYAPPHTGLNQNGTWLEDQRASLMAYHAETHVVPRRDAWRTTQKRMAYHAERHGD